VRDPPVAQLLAPKNTIGCKRLGVDIGDFETFNRSNVKLVDVSVRPIGAITPRGIKLPARNTRSTPSSLLPASTP